MTYIEQHDPGDENVFPDPPEDYWDSIYPPDRLEDVSQEEIDSYTLPVDDEPLEDDDLQLAILHLARVLLEDDGAS